MVAISPLCYVSWHANPPVSDDNRDMTQHSARSTDVDDLPLRREMVETCCRMKVLDIIPGTTGNLSVRAGDTFLVTPIGQRDEGP